MNYFEPAIAVESPQSGQTSQQALVPANGRSAQPAAAADQASMLAVFERLARDQAVDVAKLDKLIALQERILAVNAKAAFEAAFVAMQPELPTVDRRGRIVVTAREGRDGAPAREGRSTKYAKREDIVAAVRPILYRHGFGIRHRTEFPPTAPAGMIRIVTVLVHEGGHQEPTEFVAAHDDTGSKNRIQAQGSTVSYGERYNTVALLNIVTKEQDDDGEASEAKGPKPAQRKSEQQQNTPRPRQSGSAETEPLQGGGRTLKTPANVGVVVGVDERAGGVVVGQLDTGLTFGTRDIDLARAVRDLLVSRRRVELTVAASRQGSQVGKLTEILPVRADA